MKRISFVRWNAVRASMRWRVAIIGTLCCAFTLMLGNPMNAISPQQNRSEATTGIASEALSCLAVEQADGSTSGSVELRWDGEVEQARLILTVAGAEAAHSILVNDQIVARAPIIPEGGSESEACGEGEIYYLEIPPSVLVQGSNTIALTNDAQPGDSWSAAAVRLEVAGSFTLPSIVSQDGQIAGATAATLSTINFTSSYDGSNQQARIQVPDNYSNNVATPLLVIVHPRSGDMFYGEDAGYHTAANGKGWLFVSPQLHGNWPGTAAFPTPNPPGQYAYGSPQAQADIIDSVRYMVTNYNVDPNRIYVYGASMGGQTGGVTVAKYPSLFAAAFFNKGPSDWTKWHQQTQESINQGYRQSFHRQWMERECYQMINGTPTGRNPSQNPPCYQTRSSLPYARNLVHVPLSLTHSEADLLVPASHSIELRDAVNSFGPDQPVSLYLDTVVGPTCTDGSALDPTPYYHCYEDDPNDVVNFLEQFTRNARPLDLNIVTTQPQFFYWLKVGNAGNNWTYVEADANLTAKHVVASITTNAATTVSFNLGHAPVTEITTHPGIGLPSTTYLVKEHNKAPYLANYTAGYLDVALTSTGSFSLTIAALDLVVTADPALRQPNQAMSSNISVVVRDTLQNLVPNQTQVQLTTTDGLFPNNQTTFVATTTNGQINVPLTLAATDGTAEITAQVGNATGSATVLVAGDTPPTATLTTTPCVETPTATPTATNTSVPNSTPTPTPTVTPTPTATPEGSTEVILADDFESGSWSQWSQAQHDSYDLNILPEAALEQSLGLRALIDDNNVLSLGDFSPEAETRYRARFLFDPNNMTMADGNQHELFRGFQGTWPAVLDMQIRYSNNNYLVRAGILNDGTTWRYSTWFQVSDAPHSLEVDWQAASAPGANDGSLHFWIDGVLASELLGIDNDTRQIDFVRLGAISSIDSGTRGTYYFDAFESRRTTYIGPVNSLPISGTSYDEETLHEWVEEELHESRIYLPQMQR